jgi:ABC-type uncharacterized transport system substrate-binding protein
MCGAPRKGPSTWCSKLGRENPASDASGCSCKGHPLVPITAPADRTLGPRNGYYTGFTVMMSETTAKSLELFKEVVPGLSRVAVIWDPATPSHRPGLRAVEVMAQGLRLRLQTVAVRNATEFDGAFSAIVQEHAGGLVVLSTPLFMGGAGRLAELAITHKLPTMFGPREHVEAGGLLSYSPDRADLYRRAASYVDKILNGAKPAELAVQQPTKFEFVINLKTARALGIGIPPILLARADEVIE